MKRLVFLCAAAGLAAAAWAGDPVVPRMPGIQSSQALPAGTGVQHLFYVADADGLCTPVDGSIAHSTLAYSDTANSGNYFGGGVTNAPPHIVSDDLATAARNDIEVADFTFGYFTSGGLPFDAVVTFYSAAPPSAGGSGAVVGGPFTVVDLPVGGFAVHVDLPAAARFCAPPNLWLEVDYSDSTVSGGDAGPIITGDPGGAVGTSADLFGWDGNLAQGGTAGPGLYFFNGNPHADFYLEVGATVVLPKPPATTPGTAVWDTGPPTQVIFNGNVTYLGYSSGNLGAGSEQRWAATPFRLTSATTISTIDVDWFIVAGGEASNVNYIIWRRTGLAAPVNGDQVSQGVLGPYAAGTDDPEVAPVDDWLHRYFVSISLAAGDYWFTIYGDGGAAPNNAAWLTGAAGMDETLEQGWMWRSAQFPTPGFVVYNPATVQPNVGQDPEDRWNPSFTLYQGGVAPCAFDACDTNCDGSVNGFDIQNFVDLLGESPPAPCSPCAADTNFDGSLNGFDIQGFVDCLSDPC